MVLVDVWEELLVGEAVGLGDGDEKVDWVAVGVLVPVGVLVRLGVSLGWGPCVGVFAGVWEMVGVAVGVGVCAGPSCVAEGFGVIVFSSASTGGARNGLEMPRATRPMRKLAAVVRSRPISRSFWLDCEPI
jgi:hypothetical protein